MNANWNDGTSSARLYRAGWIRRRGTVGGVCAAVSAKTGLDSNLVHALTVFSALLLPAMVIPLYIVAWVILPDESGVAIIDQYRARSAAQTLLVSVIFFVALCLLVSSVSDFAPDFLGISYVTRVLTTGLWAVVALMVAGIAIWLLMRGRNARPPSAGTTPGEWDSPLPPTGHFAAPTSGTSPADNVPEASNAADGGTSPGFVTGSEPGFATDANPDHHEDEPQAAPSYFYTAFPRSLFFSFS
ncbi:MAG: PspC domain-containing protein [Actinomycetaceae bacterium]|nr:PspC domain-containing protein [Actinomycetaceae bacterium]